MKPTTSAKDQRAVVVHSLRMILLLSVAVGLKLLTDQRQMREQSISVWSSVNPTVLREVLESAERISPPSDESSLAAVLDGSGKTIGYLALTLPQAKDAIGYRGPSNVLLIFDASAKFVVGAKLLSSNDTAEHVQHVINDKKFFEQFVGWTWESENRQVDAVSGATLTSLAVAEGAIIRLGGRKPFLKFPKALTLDEILPWLPNAKRLSENGTRTMVVDDQGKSLGWIMRTGTTVETLEGYQGPTEVLMLFNMDDRLLQASIRSSYDNQPYVGYVQDESSFWKRLRGLSLKELAEFDRQVAGVDGVSGATMTSQTAVDTMVAAAQKQIGLESPSIDKPNACAGLQVRWNWFEAGTVVMVLGAVLINFTNLRGRRWVSNLWSLLLILYLGLGTGNLISQSLLLGWASAGIPWKLAPGLVFLTLLSLVVPPLTKHNLYCNQLCPHGAAQRLVKGRLKQWQVPAKLQRILRNVPGVSLVGIVLATIFVANFNAANFEPFNAYIWAVAGVSSIALAIFSLVVSLKIPMAYCRFGCPTGRLLEYSRRTRQSGKFAWQDWLVVLISATVWTTYCFM